jgi:hypothetical protein
MNRQIASQTHQQKSTATPWASGLLQRKHDFGPHTIAGGELEAYSKKKRLGLQTKLRVNVPGDIYEQEANRIADQVMAMPANSKIGGVPWSIQRLSGGPTGQRDTVPASVDQALASPGRPLEPSLRQDMEQRFGCDFSRVRVHTGATAEQSARGVNASAYTLGQEVVFGEGRFSPGTQEGKHLIAHELTHVVQQLGTDRASIRQNSGQRGLATNNSHVVSQPTDTSESTVEHMAGLLTSSHRSDAKGVGDQERIRPPLVQREATRPRAVTGTEVVADITAQTTVQRGNHITAGSVARQEWESLFRRHFTEPDQIEEEVESSHARYFYSRVYGWLDAQHFFAHIQFAQDQGLEAATMRGIEIERRQALLRGMIGPEADDPTIYSDLLRHNLITPDDFLHYREGLFIAISLGMNTMLSDQERALIRGFNDRQRAKLILDNAMSAWSAEDLVSNQLGVQFYRLHGTFINAGANADEVRQRFIDRITQFFAHIEVINDARAVRRLARSLPGRERWTSAKRTEARARSRFPELFNFASETHRVRIAVYDRQSRAEQALTVVARAVPSAAGLHIEPYGQSRYALYTGSLSHFEAVLLKRVIDRAVSTGESGALVEER